VTLQSRGTSGQVGAAPREEVLPVLDTLLQVGVALLDRNGNLELATPLALELLDVRSLEEARALWPSLHPGVAALLEHEAGAGREGRRFPVEVPTKAGKRGLSFDIQPLDADGGGAVALIQSAAARDALEMHARYASRWQAIFHLHRAHVHGLRAPLNNIHLHLHLLLAESAARDTGQPELARRLEVIRDETARLNQLLDTFFLQMADGNQEERFDLRQMIQEVELLLAPQARAERVSMTTHVPAGEVLVVGRRDRLRHACLSVLIQVLIAMPEGGELVLDLDRAPGEARIAIREGTGPRMAAEKVLDLLRGAAGAQESAASRLWIGLSIARSIVESDGGKLIISTDPGPGVVLTILLPQAPEGVGRPLPPE
jgi:signal transduction histidine kinase